MIERWALPQTDCKEREKKLEGAGSIHGRHDSGAN